METVLIVIAALCLLLGIIGSFAPGLPGPPLSWVGMLLVSLSHKAEIESSILIIAAIIAALITVLDYVMPSLSTKKQGGSKWGIWGCNIGLVVAILGLPFGPQGLLGIVFWPFAGALAGEWLKQHDGQRAIRAAWGAFLGFMCGTVMKLAYCIAAVIIVLVKIF